MWNETATLGLLKDLPEEINEGNLERIQTLIDYGKYCTSYDYGYDLCGEYAPFCKWCDKSRSCPCAYAYVQMKRSEGMNVCVKEAKEKTQAGKIIRIAVAKKK